MTFPYKHVLLVGATSGIGAAMATELIGHDVKVTAVGRRKDRLDEFVKQHGEDKASGMVLDIADQEAIPKFTSEVMLKHPDIDCIFLNAGVQNRYDFTDPQSFDLSKFHNEMTVNFTSFVTLTHAFLPYFLNSQSNRSFIFTGTHLSIVPAPIMPAYSASKAALDAFLVCLREQLKSTEIAVVHLSPPLVQTELHDAEMGPEVGRKLGMPARQFAEHAYRELASGNENIIIGNVAGSTPEQFMEIVDRRDQAFRRLVEFLQKMAH